MQNMCGRKDRGTSKELKNRCCNQSLTVESHRAVRRGGESRCQGYMWQDHISQMQGNRKCEELTSLVMEQARFLAQGLLMKEAQ